MESITSNITNTEITENSQPCKKLILGTAKIIDRIEDMDLFDVHKEYRKTLLGRYVLDSRPPARPAGQPHSRINDRRKRKGTL